MTADELALRDVYREILEKEYGIIQGKIDKIGEFKFKIRGWSITIQTALLAALFTKEMPSGWPIIFLLLLVPSLFHYLEIQQHQIQLTLMGRALVLETAIHKIFFLRNKSEEEQKRLDSNIMDKVIGTPRIGISIIKGMYRDRNTVSTLKKIKNNVLYCTQYFLFVAALISYHYYPNLFSKTQDKQPVDIHLHHHVEKNDEQHMDSNVYHLRGLTRSDNKTANQEY